MGSHARGAAVRSGPCIPLLPFDTEADWYADEIDWCRSMTGAQRGELVFWMNECSRTLAVAGIRRRHPDYDEKDVTKALVVRRYGRELAEAVWPDSKVPEA
jgi:hypothetical protein